MFKYPKCCDWLIFHETKDGIIVEDYFGETEIVLPGSEVHFLRKLDGKTDPYEIAPDMSHSSVDQLMDFFDEHDLVRYTRIVCLSLLFSLYTVCFIHPNKRKKQNAYILNQILLFSFLPMLIIGLVVYVKNGDFNWDYSLAGIFVGIVLGMILHECGHGIAGFAFGARIFEAGLLSKFLLPGAYVLLDERPVKKKIHRVQIYAAGVEMNALLAGISFLLAGIIHAFEGFLFGIAIQNLFIAGLNILFVPGFDGEKIIGELMGKNDFARFSLRILFHSMGRKKMWRSGPQGKAAMISTFCTALVQSALPILLVINLAGVIIWIIELF